MHNVSFSLSLSVFVAMEIKYDVKTVNALLDQFYEKRRLLILSAPNITDSDYQLQNLMIQVSAGFTRRFSSIQVFFKVLTARVSRRKPTADWTCGA